MGKITTVLGDIKPEQLGYTDMHDHTFLDMRVAGGYMKSIFPDVTEEMVAFEPENYSSMRTGIYLLSPQLQVVDDLEGLIKEFGYFKKIGGCSVCDPSPIAMRLDVRKMQELSRRTQLNIICTTGMYHESAIPVKYRGQSVEFYYGLFRGEIEHGIDGTEVRPGFLKSALATGSDTESAILEACIRLSAETGRCTYVHTEPMMDGDFIVELLDSLCSEYRVDHDRILICHMDNRIACGVSVGDYLEDPKTDRTLDLELQKALLGKGYNIGLDTWGMPVENPNFFMPDDFERTKALITLIDLGYGNQITLGNDFSSKLMWRQFGGHGCTRFATFGLAMLEMLGREDQAHKLVYENPARILAY